MIKHALVAYQFQRFSEIYWQPRLFFDNLLEIGAE